MSIDNRGHDECKFVEANGNKSMRANMSGLMT